MQRQSTCHQLVLIMQSFPIDQNIHHWVTDIAPDNLILIYDSDVAFIFQFK